METLVHRVPIVNGILNRWGQDIAKQGVPYAMRQILAHSESAVEVVASCSTQTVMAQESTLLVSNHPEHIDPVVLAAASPDRLDFNLVGNTLFENLSPEFDKRLIPMFVKHHMFPKGNELLLKVLERLHFYPSYSQTTEEWKSLRSLNVAATRLDQGELVAIFPIAGRRGIDEDRWFPGIGHMIHMLGNTSPTNLVMAYIEGTSSLDWLRICPMAGKALPQLKVTFSEPRHSDSYIQRNSRDTTKELQSAYETWQRGLN